MVIAHANGPTVRRFKSGRGDGFLKAIKLCRTPSFVGEVKPSALFLKILRHVTALRSVNKDTSRLNSSLTSPNFPHLLLDGSTGREGSGGRIKNFPLSVSFHHDSQRLYITWGMNNRAVGGRSSET